jgi:hypothetical protein
LAGGDEGDDVGHGMAGRAGEAGGARRWGKVKAEERASFLKKRGPARASRKLLFAGGCSTAETWLAFALVTIAGGKRWVMQFRRRKGVDVRVKPGHDEVGGGRFEAMRLNGPSCGKSFLLPRAGRLFFKKEALGLLS